MSSDNEANGNGNANGNGLARHLNWSTIPVEQMAEGIQRQMFVGNRMMICRFRFKPFLVTPEHDHPHEQMTIVERGRVRFFVVIGATLFLTACPTQTNIARINAIESNGRLKVLLIE